MSERPFRVLGVQQIAIGALDKQPLLDFWVELLGLPLRGHFESVAENVSEAIVDIGAGATRVELDLMQPVDPSAKPKVHEPALNHFGLWVDDLPSAHAWLSARGVRFAPGGIRVGAAGHAVCFVHPKPSADSPRSAEGVLLELVQAPPAVIEAFAALARAAQS
ncbi:MAG TPA: VOC family protein [Polyangiaceae bacterium]|nr:VOC family protein [Polyangiaceae bacterium]